MCLVVTWATTNLTLHMEPQPLETDHVVPRESAILDQEPYAFRVYCFGFRVKVSANCACARFGEMMGTALAMAGPGATDLKL